MFAAGECQGSCNITTKHGRRTGQPKCVHAFVQKTESNVVGSGSGCNRWCRSSKYIVLMQKHTMMSLLRFTHTQIYYLMNSEKDTVQETIRKLPVEEEPKISK